MAAWQKSLFRISLLTPGGLTKNMSFIKDIPVIYKYARRSSRMLSRMFKHRMDYTSASEALSERLKNRTESFLNSVNGTIFQHSESPYLKLFKRAGYDFDAVKSLVLDRGIEGCLTILKKKGVYIDINEFKGHKKTVRGSDTYQFSESDFNNPLLNTGYRTESGGSRSSGSKMTVPAEYIQQNNVYGVLAANENKILDKPAIIYLPILPAGEGLFFNIRFTAMGNPPVKWFSPIDRRYIKPSLSNRFKTSSTILAARLRGMKMRGPEFVDMRDTVRIIKWIHSNLDRASGFAVVTYASSALRMIIEAKKENLSLGESVFWLMGEPLTEKIYSEILSHGCRAYSLYGCNELMLIGQGCANPSFPDDMHFCKDKLAVIQDKKFVDRLDTKVNSFYFSTILETSPKIFLNTETGDYGIVEKRNCGCGFEDIGFDLHIHSVRSFEKLTAEGATFFGNDVIELIQDTLPAEFGGCATDFQLVEEWEEDGFRKLCLYVSPDVGSIDEQNISKTVLKALMDDSDIHTYSAVYWDRGETLKLKRKNPIPTARGKILPLHTKSTSIPE